MFFEEIRMVRCNRTSLNDKESITIHPRLKTQQVLGTNSGGKSSLLQIGFCPLPPDDNWFDHGGSLYQRFLHKGRTYELESHFSDKNSYSFIVDGGENINRGRTVTAQFDLVEQHLGYTKELHKFITGAVEFTSMSPQVRRDWIARFAPTDFDFAFKKHAEWKKEHSKSVTIVKYIKERLVDAKTRLIDATDVAQMRLRADQLHETLEMLMREPRLTEAPLSDAQVLGKVDEIDSRFTDFLTKEYPDTLGATDLDDLLRLLDLVKQERLVLQGEATVRADRLAECDFLREQVEQTLDVDPTAMRIGIAEAEDRLADIPDGVTGIHRSLLIPAGHVIQELRFAAAGLPSEKKTVSQLNEVNELAFTQREKQNRVEYKLEDLLRQVEHIERCEEVQCPSCSTSFKPGIEPGKLEELRQRIAAGEKVTAEMAEQLCSTEAELSELTMAVEAYAELDRIKHVHQSKYPGLFAYLESIDWQNLGRGISSKLALYERDVAYAERRTEIEKSLGLMQVRLAKYENESGHAGKILEDYRVANEAYNEVHFKVREVKVKEERVTTALKVWMEYLDCYDVAMNMYGSLRTDLINYCNHQGDLMLEELIKKTKNSIGIIEYGISEQETHETLVKDLENQLNAAVVEEEAYRRAVEAICPKKGFLAEQITQQMETVVNTVNKLIKRVWSYPLYVSPCDVTEKGITYQFPFTVNTRNRNDISEGSKSVKDIINQSFRWAGYYCMGLYDWPLHLDEIGSSFDEMHRHNLVPLIKDLVDDNHFSQILLVSHQLDGQTAYPNSETIVMDDRNITFPHPYNLHVEFE